MRPVMSRLLWPLSYGPGRIVEHIPPPVRCNRGVAPSSMRGVPKRILIGLLLTLAFAAHADVVDLTRGGRRDGENATGLSLRAEFGNDYAPYGLVGAAVSYLTSSGTAFEGGAGAGFPGVQLGVAVRQLFGGAGFNVAIELSFAGNTKQQRAAPAAIPVSDTSRYLWTSLGGGFELRPGGPFTASVIAALAFTPADGEAHFGVHGGIGYYF